MLRLHSFRHSPNPLKIRFALAELGLEYETVEVPLFEGAHRKPEFLEINPHGKVPVLQDGDLVLRESSAILVHLAMQYGAEPGSLWPCDARGVGQAMQWLFFEAAHLQSTCGTMWWNEVLVPFLGRGASKDDVIEADRRSLERSLGVVEGHLAGGREWMIGDRLTLVDCSVGIALAMLRGTRFDDSERWPSVVAYRERVRARPAWTEAEGDAIHPG